MIKTKKMHWADKLGAFSALLCIIHCLSAPIVLAMGISFLYHPLVALLFVLVAFISIYKATKGMTFKGLSLFLWLAFIGFVTSLLLEEYPVLFEYAMFLCSTCIVFGHLYNFISTQKG